MRKFNALIDCKDRGWFYGHFNKGYLFDNNLELQYKNFKKGEIKGFYGKNKKAKTITFLIRGKFKIVFENEYILLDKEGDFVIFNKEPHTWECLEDSNIFTIRFPSIKEDQKRLFL